MGYLPMKLENKDMGFYKPGLVCVIIMIDESFYNTEIKIGRIK